MEIEYILDTNDMLQGKLFSTSKNVRIKKRRIRSWLSWTFIFLCTAFIFYVSYKQLPNDYFLFATYYFLIVGVAFLFFFPLYQKYYYKKFYKKQISGMMKNYESPVHVSLSFTNESFCIKDITGEFKTTSSQIGSIIETKNYFFVRKKGDAIILTVPKQKIILPTDTKSELQQIANQISIPFHEELDWKWK